MANAGPLVIGISGASGSVYGIRLLEACRELRIESHLVVSKAAELTIAYETDRKPAEIKALADHVHPVGDIGAAIASGSFRTRGMVIAPCSIRSAAEIATGMTTTLLTRAADVTLKERRRLIVMPRETPLHTGHLRMLTQLSEIGAIIAPPMPAFYARPDSLEAMVDHSVGRLLDLLEIDNDLARRWQGRPEGRA
ncbi:UbiX family flavin prenyltransferase [Oceanibacterium hippocampi]|uniref:Flavin prenyltransferase UbiX n=1 Tax=Oceanibacterium hippocampi TaxID=745714 RepID=A0A1Y5SBC2_9PROT|nr:UbiX family flavin prenyltransferase [Oceanibacterium hippocampi]SLN35708.1 3-octaprenyl-4-hydroxybenzoate carboxy-lyase partner protein [Oceanibacterium hippocampi]